MKPKKQMIYGLIVAFVVPTLLVFVSWVIGAVHDLMFVIDEVIAATAASLVVAGLVIFVHGAIGKEGIIEAKEDIVKIPNAKQASWIQRHRIFVKKDKKADFWLMMLVLAVFGSIAILIATTFPVVPSSTNAILISNVTKGTMIALGIGLLVLCICLSTNEVYNKWEYRKNQIQERNNALLNTTREFDKSFRDLKETTQQKTKERLLDDFQNRLRNLCYDYPWDEKKRVAIIEVLNYIPERLANDPNVNSYLLFLGFILGRDSNHTIKLVKEKFLGELENLYNDPRFEINPKPILLLQELHDHSEVYLMKLVDDASSITKWSDERFQALGSNIELWELKTKDIEAHTRVSNYVVQKMDDAARNNDDVAFKRLDFLRAKLKL
jgi:hypothetical protein